jgi:hypothetical protein
LEFHVHQNLKPSGLYFLWLSRNVLEYLEVNSNLQHGPNEAVRLRTAMRRKSRHALHYQTS